MRWLFLIAVALQVANCGQSGPLRLPENASAPLAASVPPPGLLRVTPL
jgi:predicted small lipoprotein YifL